MSDSLPTVGAAVLVALAGGAGAALRHLADAAATRRWGAGQVGGILTVNLVGSLLAGLLVGRVADDSLVRVGGIALLGGFTTFSTALLQTVTLAGGPPSSDSGHRSTARAAGHAVLTAVGCVAGAALGLALGHRLS